MLFIGTAVYMRVIYRCILHHPRDCKRWDFIGLKNNNKIK